MLPLGVDRRINQNPEYNRKIRIQTEYQNTIEKSEHNRKSIIQSKNWNTYRKNRTTYKKIKTGETQKHQNTKEKESAADRHIGCENNIWRR